MEEKLEQGMEKMKLFIPIDKAIDETEWKEVVASSVLKESNSSEMMVKDIVAQSEVEIDKGKKGKRWIVVTTNAVLVKKDAEDKEVLLQIPVKGMTVENTDKVVLKNGGQNVTFFSYANKQLVQIIEKLLK